MSVLILCIQDYRCQTAESERWFACNLSHIHVRDTFADRSIAHAQNRTNQVEANKKIVYDFYRFVWEPADEAALMKWLPENYIEHNPRFRNGRTDLANLLRTRRKGQPVKVSDTLHDPPELIVAEGNLVTWIFKRMRKDPQRS